MVRQCKMRGLPQLRWIAMAFTLALWTVAATGPATAKDGSASAHAKKYSIEDLDWIAGHWVAERGDITFDEVYSEPKNGAIMGMYRVIKDEKITRYGIMAITETPDGLVFRYRLVDTNLEPLKGRDVIEKPLKHIKGNVAQFESMRFELVNPTRMELDLTQKNAEGKTEVVKFVYHRPCAGFCVMP